MPDSLKDKEQMLKMKRDHLNMKITDARLKGRSALDLIKEKEEVEEQLINLSRIEKI